MNSPHPTFVQAPEERRWKSRNLTQLYSRVSKEARDDRAAGWCWRVLESGLVVAVREIGRADKVLRYELRLARQSAPGFGYSTDEWETDVGELLRACAIEATGGDRPSPAPMAFWHRVEDSQEGGKRVLLLRSLLHGEIQPGKALCYPCKAELDIDMVVSWFHGGGIRGQRCEDHARGRAPISV